MTRLKPRSDQKITRIALVTGGGSGLGRATAQMLAAAGYQLAVVDRSIDAANQTLAGLVESHKAYLTDITQEAQVSHLFNAVEAELGPVDVLLNFAGVMITPPGGQRPSIVDASLEHWEQTFAVNARGSFLCLREMLRCRQRRPVEHGRIINVSSTAAQIGGYNGSAAYIASKGAILSLTKIAAREAAPMGITVNCIAPGAMDTPMLRAVMPVEADAAYVKNVPLGRVGNAQDVASAALFLASAEAGYITGSCIDVNGGMRMQ